MTTTSTRPPWLVPALVAGAALVAGLLALTQPWLLLIDEVAEEQLPTIAVEDNTTSEVGGEPDAAMETMDEETMDEQDAAMDDAIEGDAPATDAEPEPEPEPEPSGPVALASGSFVSRDHGTSGDVAIVQLEDGSRVLTIEGLATDNGPDLFVYLDDTAADGPEGEFDDGISLGVLRANIGDLVYEIPDDLDLDGIVSVGIWCDRFSSLFGAADLVWN